MHTPLLYDAGLGPGKGAAGHLSVGEHLVDTIARIGHEHHGTVLAVHGHVLALAVRREVLQVGERHLLARCDTAAVS